jgi:hypothetical protein
VALVAAVSLLLMALLAPLANFGVLQTLIDPADVAGTTSHILASAGVFRAAIGGLLLVAILDVVVAWALYVLLRPVNEILALLVAWLRVVYAAAFASALVNLFDVAQLVNGEPASRSGGQSAQLLAQVAASVASFANGWDLALAIFGLSLLGLGALILRSVDFPKVLGLLVMFAGVGYLVDSFGTILVSGYSLTISSFTFVGEALLIVWLFRIAFRASRAARSPRAAAPSQVRPADAVAS